MTNLLSSTKGKLLFAAGMLLLATGFTGYRLYDTEHRVRAALKEREQHYHQDEALGEMMFEVDHALLSFNKLLMGESSESEIAWKVTILSGNIKSLDREYNLLTPEIKQYLNDAAISINSDDPHHIKKTYDLLLAANEDLKKIYDGLDEQMEESRGTMSDYMDHAGNSLFLMIACLSLILAVLTTAFNEVFRPLSQITKKLVGAAEGTLPLKEVIYKNIRKDEIGQAQAALNHLLEKTSYALTQLEASNTRYSHKIEAIEASKGGIGIAGENGILSFANNALLEMFGIRPEEKAEYIYNSFDRLFAIEDRVQLNTKILPAIRSHGFWQGEMTLTDKMGKQRYIDFSFTRLEDESVICTGVDITSRKVAEKEKANVEALFLQAQKMEAIGRLTGGIAHDFNNMMTIVQGNLELLQKTAIQQSPKAQHFVETALRAVRRSTELTSHLLSFSREQFLLPKVVCINRFLPEASMLLTRAIGEETELVLNMNEEKDYIRVDVGQLETAILNLAINARDAMEADGMITIGTKRVVYKEPEQMGLFTIKPGQYIRLSVSDNGHGMDAITMSKIFDPFFTTKEQGKGTGLGLSMVYGFVKQSGGYITAESRIGEGTSIHLYFPACDPAIDDSETKGNSEQQKEKPGSLEKAHGTILIAEDEEDLLELNKNLLTDLGYTIVCAANGDSALNILKVRNDIDMVLSDIVMPGGISGRDLAREARKIKNDIKILLVSGYDKDFADEEMEPGARFLSKPYTQNRLATEVHSIMARNGVR